MNHRDLSEGRLECTVTDPRKENDGTKNAYISYLVDTKTDFQTFHSPEVSVRRRFTDFVFLHKTLVREYQHLAVPPIPDKHNMEYVRGDRFGPDFTRRRAASLSRFLKRLAQHPQLRRAAILLTFLESADWNATMKLRTGRGSGLAGDGGAAGGGGGAAGVFDSFTDTFLNAFTKVHKPDKRFLEVKERADKLDDDLSAVEKVVVRVARRQGDLETDHGELAQQFRKLVALEPGASDALTGFAAATEETGVLCKRLRDHTDQRYLSSLRDMQAYIVAVKALLKAREQKQLDFEGLTDYLQRAVGDRDGLAGSGAGGGGGGLGGGGGGLGASGFLRSKIEDVRGVDHEQSRRERIRKLDLQIDRLTKEVEDAKAVSELFDENVVRETHEFERIKAIEFRDTLGELADANVDFYKGTIDTWERFIADMEKDGPVAA